MARKKRKATRCKCANCPRLRAALRNEKSLSEYYIQQCADNTALLAEVDELLFRCDPELRGPHPAPTDDEWETVAKKVRDAAIPF